MSLVYTMKGVGGLLGVYEDKVDITPKGVMGFLAKGLKGTKSIPFSSITAIQFKKSGLARGYLQFTIPGGNESRHGLTDAASDENTFMFAGNNELALEIKNYIETRIRDLRNERLSPSGGLTDQLLKLAEMKEKGLLSEDEFLNAKNRLLS